MGAMYRVFSLRLEPNLAVRPVSGNKFYLRLTIEKMHLFAVFTKKYLRPYDCSVINFTAAMNFANPKTETQSQINEIEIVEMQT